MVNLQVCDILRFLFTDADIPDIELWMQKSKLFVKTDVVTDILCILEDHHCVLLTGVSGMGKTMTAHNIALHLFNEKGYRIVPCGNVNDIKKRYKTNDPQVFFVDDICGKYTANINYIENWIKIEEFLKYIVNKGKTIILATCRTEVFNEEAFQETFDLFKKDFYELTLKYSIQDKIKIARKYLNKDDQILSEIIGSVEFSPLMCFLYSQHKQFDINEFLNSPYETFRMEWNTLQFFDKEKFCVLFLCVIYNGKLNESMFDVSNILDKDDKKKLKSIFEYCKLSRDTSRSTIEDKLKACVDTYFIKVDGVYKVIHDKMFDFLCCYFGKKFIAPIIKFADDKLICERVQLESIQKTHSEFTICISSTDENKYKDRLRIDLENGKIHGCFNNIQMKYREYRHKFLDVVKDFDGDIKRNFIDIKDDNGNTSFIISCMRGYEELVVFFISVGAEVDARNGWFTPLTAACRDGHLGTVETLLDKGATVNQTNIVRETPLHTACICGHFGLVRRLIERNADINKKDKYHRTPLYLSCLGGFKNIVRILIDKGCNVNSVDVQGRTALFVACEAGYTEIVTLLIDKNADIFKPDIDGRTPLNAAGCAGNDDIVNILTENNADDNILYTDGKKTLFGTDESVKNAILVNGADICVANKPNLTSFNMTEHYVQVKDVVSIKSFEELPLRQSERTNISWGLNYNYQKQKIDTIRNLLRCGWAPLYEACIHDDIEPGQSLIKSMSNSNMKNVDGDTPLVVACQQGNDMLIDILLTEGADIRQALFIAVQKNYWRTFKILLCRGGDLCFKTKDKKSLITFACEQGLYYSVKLLLENGNDVNHVNNDEHSPICIACNKGFLQIVELLIKQGSKLNKPCQKDGKTPLYSAYREGFYKIAEILIKYGANVNAIDENGKTFVHLACSENNFVLFLFLTKIGVDSTKPDKDGRYPLFVSMYNGYDDISKSLVQKGCPIAIPVDDKKTALITVFESGNTELSRMLVSKGYTYNLTNFLYYRCRLGMFKRVNFRDDNETDIQTIYKYGYTPMILADIGGNDDLSEYLQSHKCDFNRKRYNFVQKYGGVVYIEERKNYTCFKIRNKENSDNEYKYLFKACMNGQLKSLINKQMLSKINVNIFFTQHKLNGTIYFEQTPLCLACRRGHSEVVKLLLNYGANVNLTFEDDALKRYDLLSVTIRYGYTPLFAACQRKYYKIANLLLEKGADVNKALYDACKEGYSDTVQFLLRKGTDVNSLGRHGQTALYAACIGGYYTIVKILIDQGAFLDIKVKYYPNSIQETTCLDFVDAMGNQKLLQLFIDRWTSVNTSYNFGRTLMHIACTEGKHKIVEILINKGTDINIPDMSGASPLLACVLQYKNNVYINKSMSFDNWVRTENLYSKGQYLADDYYKIVKQLIENQADIKKADKEGRTPLSLAREMGDTELITILLHKKVNHYTELQGKFKKGRSIKTDRIRRY